MKKLMLAMFLVPSLAFAAETTSAASEDPMSKWVPPKVKNAAKDKQEIQALFRTMDAASRTGDIDAAAALIDFPVTMITDDSKGEAMGDSWSREQWTKVMEPFYAKPMKDMKVTHKPEIFLLSDSLATVDDVTTMTQGGKTMTSRNSMFLVRKDGKWRVKSMAEGGWGDMMAEAPRGTASTTEPATTEGTGRVAEPSGSQTTGSGSQDATKGTGSVAEPPGSQTTKSGSQDAPERTTK